ncbi:anthranilate synthase component I [Candidatus Peregrinibacteria bacterium]|nr:anthranilate synthase component I [Candidatus Peregrinibacteria bacterium]MBT7703254.1 anthranilate synthase component I [Candidatus Peregrinibacteria bacterium]
MGREHSFLLESAEQDGEMGRYSFIGFDPIEVLEFDENEDPLKLIKEKMESYEVEEEVREGLMAGFVGYFSYEVIHHVEDIPKSEKKAGMDIPEGIFFLPRVVICFDHLKHVAKLHYLVGEGEKEDGMNEILAQIQAPLQIPFIEPSEGVTDYELEPGRDEFIEQVKKCKRYIEEGEVFQIVVSHSIVAKTKRSSFELYRGLRHANPSPYMYFLQFEGFAVVGASPETLVRVESGEVLVRPIAGTRPRGKNEEEDQRLEAELKVDPKELAEHMMLVDLGRNDVGRVAEVGTVIVPAEKYIQRFSSVMHMISDVTGNLREGKDMFDVFRACFPAGTLSGAPKIRAAELISGLEKRQRGIYGGAVGYFDFSGNMDFAIAIRTMVCKENKAYIQAGAGIVYDSVPEREHEECLHKAKSCLSVL